LDGTAARHGRATVVSTSATGQLRQPRAAPRPEGRGPARGVRRNRGNRAS